MGRSKGKQQQQQKAAPKKSKTRSSSSSARDEIELLMECFEEALSPAQMKAIKQAQADHEKANDQIKEIRAGNTLVPSSQPNTFTIVPPTPKPQPAPPPPPPPPPQALSQPEPRSLPMPTLRGVMKAQPLQPRPQAQQVLTPPQKTAQNGKNLSDLRIQQITPRVPAPQPSLPQKSSPDIILISETPAPSKPVVPTSPQLIPALPQQMYKMVPPGSQLTPLSQGQWVIRPLVTVSPQQMVATVPPSLQKSLPASTARVPAIQPAFADVTSKLVEGTPGSGLKKASEPATPTSSPQAKKKTPPGKEKEPPGEINSSGNWVPLDEYYYGTMDGDQNYEEEKGEFRFKCWYCSKMLYNNVRAMQHIQGHIDSSKQQNIDLSDLTQCKQCYKQFDTPFEMQTHMEKVHLSNKVLMCRICEKDQPTPRDLTQHMRQNHHPCEMPYVCQLCNFKSSMYNDVVDHFKKKHDSSQHLLCLYCLRTFLVKFVSQGWGQTQTYYGHLLKHQSKSTTKKCVICRLTFFNSQDVKLHRKTHHIAHHKGVLGIKDGKYQQQEQVMIKLPPGQVASSKQKVVKSLNVPASCKVLDIGGVVLPGAVSTSKCVECKTSMGSTDHYKKFINCSMCRFATSCSIAYANHMMGFHSGQMSSLNLNIPWERPMPQPMYCSCGFSSKYGNKIANHLAFCSKQTCFKTSQGSPPSSAEKSKATEKGDENLLDVLGLMKRRSLTTRGKRAAVKDESGSRTREKSEEKSEPADSKRAKIEKEAEPVDSKKAKIEKEAKDEKKKPGPKKKPRMGPKKRMAQIKAARARRGEKEEAEEEMEDVDTEITEKKEIEAAETDISNDADKITDKNIAKEEGSDDKSEVADTITDKKISKEESSEGTDSTAVDKATKEESKEETGSETAKEERSKDVENAGVRREEQDSSKESEKDVAGDVNDKSDEPKIFKDEEKKEESMEVSEAQADDTGNKDISNETKLDKESETAEADKDDQMSNEKEIEGKVKDSVKETGADDEVESADKEMIDQTETDVEKLENVQADMEMEITDTDIGAKGVSTMNDNLESEAVADSLAEGDEESSKVDENMEVNQEEERKEDVNDQSHDLIEKLQSDDVPKETEEPSEEIVPAEEEKTEIAELEESKEADKSETEESEETVRADTEEKADNQSESAAEKDSQKQVSASAGEDTAESDKEVHDPAGGTEAELKEATDETERGGDAIDPKAESSQLEPPAEQTQGDNKSGQLEESAETAQETSKESSTLSEGDSKNIDTQQSSSANRQSSHERSQEREHGSHRDTGSHGDSRHSRDHDRHQENRSYDSRHRPDDRHRHDNRSHGDRHGYDDRYRHDDRSRGGYQGSRSYDRNWDNRDRSYDRDHRGGDYRRDDRGQQGFNRGPQDRNQDYNRNQHGYNRGGYRGNFRGGYNQNYRGGYRGGYY